jgi:hypothetical protein
MPKYTAGDTILVDGQKMKLGSWPADDTGPFFATYTDSAGSEVQGTYWAGQVETDGEPVHTSANVSLVQAGDGVERSTLGDIHDALEELNPELEGQLDEAEPDGDVVTDDVNDPAEDNDYATDDTVGSLDSGTSDDPAEVTK